MRRFVILSGAILAGVLSQASSTAQVKPDPEAGPDYPEELVKSAPLVEWKIRSGDVACAESIKMLGLPESVLAKSSAKLVTLEVNNTPYLSEQLIGTPLWHVVIPDWPKKIKYVTPLDVYVDPVKGRVLELRTRWPEDEPPIAPEPSADSAAQQMLRSGQEKYHSFAPSPPLISFIDALDILQQGGANPLAAKQLTGVWVRWSRLGEDPRPMWVITLRGIQPIPAAFEGVPVDARNHFRYVVDPIRKRLVFGSSRPQPDSHPEIREDKIEE